jgi:hypothetical protein
MKRRAKGKKPTTDWRSNATLVAYDIELVQRFGAGIQKLFDGAFNDVWARLDALEAAQPQAPDLSGEQSKAFQELAERGVE